MAARIFGPCNTRLLFLTALFGLDEFVDSLDEVLVACQSWVLLVVPKQSLLGVKIIGYMLILLSVI
jgi:hypothetical protein